MKRILKLLLTLGLFIALINPSVVKGSVVSEENNKVKVEFDGVDTIKLSTKEKGTILYAYKTCFVESDPFGNIVSLGEPYWAADTERELYFTDDVSTWRKYSESITASKISASDVKVFLYTCVKLSNGKYTEKESTEIEMKADVPTISYTISYNSDKTVATINATSSSKSGIVGVSGTTGKSDGSERTEYSYKGEKSVSSTFKTEGNGYYTIIAESKMGYTCTEEIVIDSIDYIAVEDKYEEKEIVSTGTDNMPPVIKFEGMKKEAKEGFEVKIKVTDDTEFDYMILPDYTKVDVPEATFFVEPGNTYIFLAYDVYGNEAKSEITVKKIGDNKPATSENIIDFSEDGRDLTQYVTKAPEEEEANNTEDASSNVIGGFEEVTPTSEIKDVGENVDGVALDNSYTPTEVSKELFNNEGNIKSVTEPVKENDKKNNNIALYGIIVIGLIGISGVGFVLLKKKRGK